MSCIGPVCFCWMNLSIAIHYVANHLRHLPNLSRRSPAAVFILSTTLSCSWTLHSVDLKSQMAECFDEGRLKSASSCGEVSATDRLIYRRLKGQPGIIETNNATATTAISDKGHSGLQRSSLSFCFRWRFRASLVLSVAVQRNSL